MDIRTVNKRLEGVSPDLVTGRSKRYYLSNAAPALLEIDVLNPSRQRAELDAARTRKLRIEIDLAEGRSLDGDSVRLALSMQNSRLRARLSAVAAAQAGRANPEDPKRAEAAIADGINDALTECSDDIFGSGRAVEAASEANGHGVVGHLSETESGVELGAGSVEN
jgi:hypothetical protein